jgi:hypothetical protein
VVAVDDALGKVLCIGSSGADKTDMGCVDENQRVFAATKQVFDNRNGGGQWHLYRCLNVIQRASSSSSSFRQLMCNNQL